MICSSCAWAAERNRVSDIKTAKELHESCKGCVCQHKTGDGWVKKKAPRTTQA